MKTENKKNYFYKIILFSFLIAIPPFVWGVFIRSSNNNQEEVVENKIPEVEYPRPSGNYNEEDFFLNVGGAFSLYYDKEKEEILYEKSADEKLPIASISKIMTAHVVLKNYNLEESLGVTEYDVISRTEFRDFRAWSGTKIGDILYPMIIESNNSAAFSLALISDRFLKNNLDNSVESFVSEMNKEAKEMGLTGTYFINPSGLDAKDKYNQSTAREVVVLAKYIIEKNEKIFEISKMPSYRLYSPDKTVYYDASTTNIFLSNQKKEWSDKIYGGKTGWTRAAYGCLLIVLEVPETGGYIINVVLGAEDRFLEMEKLINYVYESYIF